MSLGTGGSTTQFNTAPGNTAGQQLQQGQIGSAFNASGGLGTFAAPSNLYNLTPAENMFTGLGMGMGLPGAQANRALGYVMPGSPAGDMFQNYFRNFIAPTVQNNAIASGYGGRSGASMEALARAGQTAAMQGLTSFGMPMAQADVANNAQGMQYAGLQRQTQIQDLGRVQNLLQSLAGMLPSQVQGGTTNTTQQGPGVGASLLGGAGSLLAALSSGGQNSMLAGLAGAIPWSAIGSGLSSLGSGIGGLFSSNPATNPATASNYYTGMGEYLPESYQGYSNDPYDSYQPDFGSLAY